MYSCGLPRILVVSLHTITICMRILIVWLRKITVWLPIITKKWKYYPVGIASPYVSRVSKNGKMQFVKIAVKSR